MLASATATFVAFVAVVADVAEVAVAALPPMDKLATGVVLDTVKGAVPVATVDVITPEADIVVAATVPPDRFVAVVAEVAVAALPPIERLEAVPVNPVPAPLNDVALKTPVFGTKLSFVELVVAALLPLEFNDRTG